MICTVKMLLEPKNWSKEIGMFFFCFVSLLINQTVQPWWFKGHAHLEGYVHQVWLIDVTRKETTHFLPTKAEKLGKWLPVGYVVDDWETKPHSNT